MRYDGAPLPGQLVVLERPTEPAFTRALKASELDEHQRSWYAKSEADHASLFFAVVRGSRAVGQVMLHDIDQSERVALVGYHIFLTADRRHGFGSDALRVLKSFVMSDGKLRRLVIVTGREHVASRRTAEGACFTYMGAAREGPHLVAYGFTTYL